MKGTSAYRDLTWWGLLLFAVGLPISHVPAQIGIGMAVLGWLAEGALNKRWQYVSHPFMIPLAVYLGWNVLAAAISERPAHSLGAVVDNEWPVFIMLMMYCTVDEERKLRQLLNVFLASASIAIIYGIWQVVGGHEYYRGTTLTQMGWGFYRAEGFYGFYLTFAAFAMTVFFLASAHAFELKRWQTALLTGFSFLAVAGTFARSMWLSFAAAIPLFAFTRGRRVGLIVTFLLCVTVAGGVLTIPAVRSRLVSIIEPGQNETRLNLWKTAVRVSESNPLLGVGEDNWDLVFERYRVAGYYDTIVHPHNDYLTVLVSSGIFGLGSFLAMWVIALVGGFKTAQQAATPFVRTIALGSTFALMGLLVGSLFQNYYGTFINCLGWWFIVGLLLTAGKNGLTGEGKR